MLGSDELDREIMNYIQRCYEAYRAGRCIKEPAISASVINEGMRPSPYFTRLCVSPRGEYRLIQGALRRLSCAGILEKSIGLVGGKERACYAPVNKPNRATWTSGPDAAWLRDI